MTSDSESGVSGDKPQAQSRPLDWLKVGVVAAGSAFLGGLAGAWYFRHTLNRLRQAEGQMQDSESGSSPAPSDAEE